MINSSAHLILGITTNYSFNIKEESPDGIGQFYQYNPFPQFYQFY